MERYMPMIKVLNEKFEKDLKNVKTEFSTAFSGLLRQRNLLCKSHRAVLDMARKACHETFSLELIFI